MLNDDDGANLNVVAFDNNAQDMFVDGCRSMLEGAMKTIGRNGCTSAVCALVLPNGQVSLHNLVAGPNDAAFRANSLQMVGALDIAKDIMKRNVSWKETVEEDGGGEKE